MSNPYGRVLNTSTDPCHSSSSASWHTDYRDTAWIYIGGFPYDHTEGDILTVFSQFGEPVSINLIRDKETGKSKGFAFLKYEDQRSTDLAVDNLGGATVGGRILKVDHTRYKRKEDEDERERDMEKAMRAGDSRPRNGDRDSTGSSEEAEEQRPMLKEEVELQKLIAEHDEDDPMKEYLVQEKKEQVAAALDALRRKSSKRKHKERKNRDHHKHRPKHSDHSDSDRERRRRHRSGKRRSRSRP